MHLSHTWKVAHPVMRVEGGGRREERTPSRVGGAAARLACSVDYMLFSRFQRLPVNKIFFLNKCKHIFSSVFENVRF